MKDESRTLKSSKNAFFAMICQCITLVLSFITRSLFIKYLSNEYLGLNGVFSNIISFLCLAELGVGNVLLYNLYKPLKDNDETKIIQTLALFKKLYTIIASFILVLGLFFIPILPFIINGISFNFKLVLIYLLFLANTIGSYLYAYKIFLLTADQKNYIVSKTTIFITILKEGIQIIILIVFQNYYLFLMTTIVTTILKNIVLSYQTDQLFPYLNKKVKELEKETKKSIFSDFKDIFLYKIANVALYSTDNILISSLLNKGTLLVGIYSNYLLITDALNKLIGSVFQAFTASIGNLNTSNESEKKYMVFRSLNFMAYWIYGVVCACLFLLVNPFIQLFAGEQYLFSTTIVIIIIIAFYIDGTFTPIWIFRETTGIFKKSKNIAIVLALTNIILSIILGLMFGVSGILGATILSRLLTTYWYEPYLILKSYLKESFFKHVCFNIQFMIKNIVMCIIMYLLFQHISIHNYFEFALYGFLIFLGANGILLVLNIKATELKFLISRFKLLVTKIRKKEVSI